MPTTADLTRRDRLSPEATSDLIRRSTARAAQLMRRNVAMSALVLIGLALRVVTEIAYWPAVQFPDSGSYIGNARSFSVRAWHPAGYPLFLRLLSWTHHIGSVTALQHLLGVASALFLYSLLRRAGASRGWAAAGTTPILLDPMQIYLEQYVLSDVLFMFLVIVVLWAASSLRITPRIAIIVGLVLAYAAIVRTVAVVIALPVLALWLVRRVGWRNIAACAAAVAIPLLGYAAYFDAEHHVFSLQGFSGRWLYGRVAGFTDCSRDSVPARVRVLCPTTPASTRVEASEWVWNPRLPYVGSEQLPKNPIVRSKLAGTFAHDVISHQPLAYLGAVSADFLRSFSPSRDVGLHGWFTGSWRFWIPGEPPFWRATPMHIGFGLHPAHAHVLLGPAWFLHDYERWVYTPGLLGAVTLIACVAAGVLRRRDAVGQTCLLLAASGLLLLLVPIATVEIDYRYVLSAQELIVAGGALAGATLWQRISATATPARRRVLLVASGVGALALVASNLTASEVYSNGVPVARPVALGAEVDISHRLAVRVNDVQLVRYHCVDHKWVWVYRFTAQARWLRGEPDLVASDDFSVRGPDRQHPRWSTILPSREPGLLRPFVVGRRYPQTSGAFFFTLATRGGILDYTDPLGAGTAAWRFSAPADNGFPDPGTPCLATVAG